MSISPALLFKFANWAVLPGWGMLLCLPEHEYTPKVCTAIGCFVGCIYVYSLLNGQSIKGASFSTLKGVTAIFRKGDDFVANGCWVHYLAFDLLVGMLITQDSITNGISQWFMKPLLILTLMLGPSGFLAYTTLKLLLIGKLN